jgi:transposase
MSEALNSLVREEIVSLHQSGLSNRKISISLGCCIETVRTLVNRYKSEGVSGLLPRYKNCGQNSPKPDSVVYEKALNLRREHPSWGSGYIRMKLREEYSSVASERTLSRWFSKAGLREKKVSFLDHQ